MGDGGEVNWIIFYADGSTFTGKPEDAPREYVVCITQGSRILHGRKCDYYCWEHDQWVEHDLNGLETYLNNCKYPIRLCGYTVPPQVFKAIFERAKEHKTGG